MGFRICMGFELLLVSLAVVLGSEAGFLCGKSFGSD